MKRFVAIIAFLAAMSAASVAQTFYGTTNVAEFRAGRDKEFRERDTSPLTDAGFEEFSGLNYFPMNRSYRVIARFSRTGEQRVFEMPTSSGNVKRFVKYGVLTFRLNGKTQRLSVFQSDPATLAAYPEYAHLLFLPFKDATNRSTTFGGGRYLSIVTPKGKTVILDFNLAYNPSCAYGSDRYSCPVPPQENRLSIEIAAGEKRFQAGID